MYIRSLLRVSAGRKWCQNRRKKMAGSGSTVYNLNSFSRARPLSLSVYKQNHRHLPPSTSCCSGRRSLFSSASAASYSSCCRSFGSFGANTDLFDIQSLRQQKKRNCTVLAMSEAGRSDLASFTDEEWKKRLTPEQFYVTRQKGTERAFTGVYWNTKIPGTYHCVCCDTPLFESSTKFDSGTGWPSYYQPLGNNVKTKLDLSIFFMPRQEVICAVCEAHLGHVFNDGPPPTGKRYCINSAALKLKPRQ